MTIIHQKKQNNNKNAISAILTGLTDITAVVITGVAVATTIALKDEKIREKIMKTLIDVKNQVTYHVDELKTRPNIEKTAQTIKKIMTDTIKVVEASNKRV